MSTEWEFEDLQKIVLVVLISIVFTRSLGTLMPGSQRSKRTGELIASPGAVRIVTLSVASSSIAPQE